MLENTGLDNTKIHKTLCTSSKIKDFNWVSCCPCCLVELQQMSWRVMCAKDRIQLSNFTVQDDLLYFMFCCLFEITCSEGTNRMFYF